MSHTYSSLLTHVVFSKHRRAPLLSGDWRGEMHAYLGGIVRELRGAALMVGGTGDHVHMLVSLDIFWLKDDSLEDSANLPEPDVIAAEIAEDLQAALDQFVQIAAELKK